MAKHIGTDKPNIQAYIYRAYFVGKNNGKNLLSLSRQKIIKKVFLHRSSYYNLLSDTSIYNTFRPYISFMDISYDIILLFMCSIYAYLL